MFRTKPLLFIFTVLLSLSTAFGQTAAPEDADEKNMGTIIHLLGYLGRDYPNAVQDGKIISELEYDEMLEFSSQVLKLVDESESLKQKSPNIISNIHKLMEVIDNKGDAETVNNYATQLKDEIIQLTGMKTFPDSWPDLKTGALLYTRHCSVCHGIKGDGNGPGAVGLDPLPTDFLDAEGMREVSPYQAYNTVKLGVPGTSMLPFTNFKESDFWDVAFYVKSLRFLDDDTDSVELRKIFAEILPQTDLKTIAVSSDTELNKLLGLKNDNSTALKALRQLKPLQENYVSLTLAKEKLSSALEFYKVGDFSSAKSNALTAYLEGIEPVETRLRSINPTFTVNLESQMMKVRQLVSKGGNATQVSNEVEKALQMIDRSEQMLSSQQLNYWLTFVLAASIMLREGLEAFLVLFIILVIARNLGANKATYWIHGGWITAVLMGIAGWFLTDYIIRFGGKNREIMEGVISLVAVAILLWAGFWLHSKTSARKWQEFVKNKIVAYLEKDRMIGLAAFSFMVVFREVFEVILFLKVISLEANANNQSAIGLGSLAAVLLLFIMAYFFMKYSKKIPIKQLFLYSSWLIVLLAFILMGKGLHSLQESGWLSVHSLPGWIQIDWLGIYPTVETIVGQISLVFIVMFVWFYQKKSMKLDFEVGKN